MDDFCYVVKGYISSTDMAKGTKAHLYIGTNPMTAFSYMDWQEDAEVEIELWVQGRFNRKIQ